MAIKRWKQDNPDLLFSKVNALKQYPHQRRVTMNSVTAQEISVAKGKNESDLRTESI